MEMKVDIQGIERLSRNSEIVAKIAAEEVMKGLLASGLLVEKEAKESIQNGQKTGRLYKRGAKSHRASAPGEAPASDTGRLTNSINVRPVQGELAVEVAAGSGAVKYARMLEHGTAKMAARPFLFPAAEKSRPAINKRMEKALDRTIDRATKLAMKSIGK